MSVSNTTFEDSTASSTAFLFMSVTDETTQPPGKSLSSSDVDYIVFWSLRYVITPSISFLGMIANFVSIVVISKEGYRRSSNILLVTLAVVDFSYLMGNGMVYIYRDLHMQCTTDNFPRSYFLFLWYYFMESARNWGVWSSMVIPSLITVERLVAIFLPLKFNVIVTPGRTFAAAMTVLLLFGGYIAYFVWTQSPDDIYSCNLNTTIIWHQHIGTVKYIDGVINQLTGIVPIIFVVVGCLAIGIRIKTVSRYRNKMTSNNQKNIDTSRTNRTLLSVCFMFSVTSLYAYIVTLINPLTDQYDSVSFQIRDLAMTLNSSCNFLIYVATNPKFKNRICGCNCKRSDG